MGKRQIYCSGFLLFFLCSIFGGIVVSQASIAPVIADTVYPIYTLTDVFPLVGASPSQYYADLDEMSNFYCADWSVDVIHVYDANGGFLRNISGFGNPISVAVSGNRIYVTDSWTDNISVLENDILVDSHPILNPIDIEVDSEGRIYVTEWNTYSLMIFDASFTLLGTVPGFAFPEGVGVSPDGRIFVMDRGTDNVTIIAPDYTVLGSFGTSGSNLGEFLWPFDIEVGVDGYIYIADAQLDWVQIFSPDLELVGVIRGIDYATGVDVNDQGTLYINSHTNENITIWHTTDLGDHEGPQIINVQINPVNPLGGTLVDLTATITDFSGVGSVNVTISGTGITPSTVTMTKNGDTYNATLGGFPSNSLVTLNLTAWDTSLQRHSTNVIYQFNVLSPPLPLPIDTGLIGIGLGGLALVVGILAFRRRAPRSRRKK